MKFRYPLQKIVDLKGSEKSMAEWEYAAALGALQAARDKLDRLRDEKDRTVRELSERTLRPTPLAEIQRLQQTIDWLDQQMRSQTLEVRQAEEQKERRRTRLTDKMIDEKVWLNAKDKAHGRFLAEWLAREQNELDEMAIMRAAASART